MSVVEVMQSALTQAKAVFEDYLLAYGTSCTLKKRSANNPTTANNQISKFAGRKDPATDSSWVELVSDTTAYTGSTTVYVALDIPSKIAAENAGQIVEKNGMGYASVSADIEINDVLVGSNDTWLVVGVRTPTPAIYKELTVQRR